MIDPIIYESSKILVTKNTVKMKVPLPRDINISLGFRRYYQYEYDDRVVREVYSVRNIIGLYVVRESLDKLLSVFFNSILILFFIIIFCFFTFDELINADVAQKPSLITVCIAFLILFFSLYWVALLLYRIIRPRYFLQFSTGDGIKTVLVDYSKNVMFTVKKAVEKAISEQ